MNAASNPTGYVTFTLHSHLPYVVHHGTWPHGLDWLHEAAAETYLPLLRVLEDLESRGLALKANVNLSPILLEQLDHPTFKSEFPKYLKQKIEAAQLDQREWAAKGESHFVQVAQFWERFYTDAATHFEEIKSDIIAGFRHFYDTGAIEIITCGATHGYFALLGSDASVRAQVRMGVETHKRFFGRAPKGIWLPECAYRPEGEWSFPVSNNGASSFKRAGVEQILAENGIQFFFIDTHLVESRALFTPYQMLAGDVPIALELEGDARASYYRPYFAGIPRSGFGGVAFFTRDPKTGVQVWSGEIGYPGDSVYLDFHKKRWPGGHRYWQVTHSKADLADKTPYFPDRALARTADHGRHFAHLAQDVLRREPKNGVGAPPILTAPFDAELFGHWWFEGPEWLRHVAIELGRPDSPVKLATCSEYLDRYSAAGYLTIPEGSWGKNGTHEVWLNPETEWTWKHIYPAEKAVVQMSQGGRWRENDLSRRLGSQLCRELMLLESSDWQFLITTIHARDYAEKRFQTHLDQFNTLLDGWRQYESTGRLSAEATRQLEKIEERDSVFPSLTPEIYL
jgi:1,4-alpha-glucan branching enzyme